MPIAMKFMQRGIRHSRSWLGAFALAFSVASGAHAVAIDTGDGSGNTAAPVDDFGFDSVGITGAANNRTAVYLGSGWVITADHVGDHPVTFDGVTYQPVASSGVQLSNTAGQPPDLYIFRVHPFPSVAPVTLASQAATIGEAIFCAGNGRNRAATSTQWNANWQEMPPYVYEGYEVAPGRTMRWGQNELTDVGNDITLGSRTTRTIETVFDESGVTDEFQAWNGDSGGGCFVKRGGEWELVGVMYAQGVFGDPDGGGPLNGQPANTVAYGNDTLISDVFFYRDQIEDLAPQIKDVPSMSRWGAGILALAIVGAMGWRRRAR